MQKQKVKQRQYKNELQSSLNFTDEDLEANRAGYMTDEQRIYVKKHTLLKVTELEGGIRFGVVFFGGAFGFIILCGIIGIYIPLFILLGFILLCIVPQFLLRYIGSVNQKLQDYQKIPLKGDVSYQSGVLWLKKGEFLSPSQITVDGTSFLVNKEVHAAFSQLRHEHKKWIVYYSPYNQCILSAEPLFD